MPRRPTTGPAEEAPPAEVRVAVVHGRPLERGHICQEVEVLAGYRVVLSVARGEDLLEAVHRGTEVDMALVQVSAGGTAGSSTLALLRDNWPGVALVALADGPEVELTARAFYAGAGAVLDLLATEPEALRAAVADVREDHLHLNAVMERMLRERGPKRPERASGPTVKLTRCEKSILYWMGHGSLLTQRGIAEKVQRDVSTVHSHIKSIYAKLGVHGQRAALRRAVQCGLLEG